MKYLDLTLPTSAGNLACDEALLEYCEASPEPGVLRFFEPDSPMVVLGFSNRLAVEADVPACQREKVPILRRLSGGGTVVLGPGCLAYSLVLPIDSAQELRTVTGTNRFVMERNRATLERLVRKPVHIQGHTDLTIGDRKFSGNSQRRLRRALLFHGTFLLDFDLECVERLLHMPTLQPDYRGRRRHRDFLINLGIPATRVKAALREAWQANETWTVPMDERIAHFMNERYGRPDWHQRR